MFKLLCVLKKAVANKLLNETTNFGALEIKVGSFVVVTLKSCDCGVVRL